MMVSVVIIDCSTESEQAMGLLNMIEENLRLPYTATILGLVVHVEMIEHNNAGEL